MQLQTNNMKRVESLNKQTKGLNVLLAIVLVGIPVGVAILMNIQGLFQMLKMHMGQIWRGVIIGMATLPVMIYIGIKTDGKWYTKKWSWIVLSIMIIGILAAVFLMSKGMVGMDSMPGDLGMPTDMPSFK